MQGAARNAPAQLKTNIENTHQFRFASTSGAVTSVTDTLILHGGIAATTAVLGYAIRQNFKVQQIEIWTPPASQGASATCSVLFPASQRSMAREVTDTTVSTSTPAHVRCGPPADSLCSFWADGNAGTSLFTLSAPPGSIIDLFVKFVDRDGPSDVDQNPSTLVAATVGTVYYGCLDSQTKAGSIYQPIGLQSV